MKIVSMMITVVSYGGKAIIWLVMWRIDKTGLGWETEIRMRRVVPRRVIRDGNG